MQHGFILLVHRWRGGFVVRDGELDGVPEMLRRAGLRCTQARLDVLSLLLDRGIPLAHTDVAAEPRLDGVDRVTLYRTLTALNDAGLAHKVQGLDGAWRFCAHDERSGHCAGDHPHALCSVCGAMTCLVGQPLAWVAVPDGFEVWGKQTVVYGRCPACAERP
jgi:Fur family ferric uptake transcriptional regulator/Fur family zinc uptake transcriptional regulator